MPTERLSAIAQDGSTRVVLRKTPYFPGISRSSSRFDMATYRLESGEGLSPTGERNTFRTDDGSIVVTLTPAANS
jgi:hypothetical protein